MAADAPEPAGSDAEPAAQRQADRLHRMVMDALRQRIAAREPGMVKLGDEVWRAELANLEDPAREAGAIVTAQSVEGVTLKVR